MQNDQAPPGQREEENQGGHGDFNFTRFWFYQKLKAEASAANCCGFHKAEWVESMKYLCDFCSLFKIFPK